MDQFAAQLNCSKRTLYALASSKEQLGYPRCAPLLQAGDRAGGDAPLHALEHLPSESPRYLEAVAEALRPATVRSGDDVADFRPAAEIYEQNTLAAAHAGA